MQYRTRSLIKSYASETAVTGRHRLARAAARLLTRAKNVFNRLDIQLTGCWHKSGLRDYFIRLGKRAAHGLSLMHTRSYVNICLAGCGLMSLGFLVVTPPAVKPSHRVRIDINRPALTALSPGETLNPLSTYELAAFYESITGRNSDWFYTERLGDKDAPEAASPGAASGADAPAQKGKADDQYAAQGWQSSRSPLAVQNGRVLMRTGMGRKNIENLGALNLSAQSTERPLRDLKKFAAGTAGPDRLLAELSLQGANSVLTARILNTQAELAPDWGSGAYGTKIFAEPPRHWSGQYLAETGRAEKFCPQERMEQTSWLNMLYASHSTKSIYTVKQAGHYRPYVERFSTLYSLQPSLVYAIMRVESGFNPLAISRANALGLMQVVPETAGNEVHAFLRGKKIAPKPEVLFMPESNIEYGTAYLHLLTTRHFKDVKNPASRELCIIAAYNGGPGAVYRVFSRDRSRAVEQINRLTPEQLYVKLLSGLASQETRDYLPKVLAARNDFLRGQARIQ